MIPRLKFIIFIGGILSGVFAVIGGCSYLFWSELDLIQQSQLAALPSKLLIYPMMGGILLILFVSLLIGLLFVYFIIPILQISEEVKLISTVNDDYRVPLRGSKEVQTLIKIVNESGDVLKSLRTKQAEEIKAAHAELDEEHSILVALMSELPSGVLVCDQNGRILLYNRQLQNILFPKPEDSYHQRSVTGVLGLGRSIFNILNRKPIVHSWNSLHQQMEQHQVKPISRFITSFQDHRFLEINMAPVLGANDEGEIIGYVLVVDETTSQIESDSRRDELIYSVTENLKNPLATIRKSISVVLEDGDLEPEQLNEKRESIAAASLEIKQQIDQANIDYIKHGESRSIPEDILVDDLLKLWEFKITDQLDSSITFSGPTDTWLQIKSFSVAKSITTFFTNLIQYQNVSKFHIQTEADEAYLTLNISWPDGSVESQYLERLKTGFAIEFEENKNFGLKSTFETYNGTIVPDSNDVQKVEKVQFSFPITQIEAKWTDSHIEQGRPVSFEFNLFKPHERYSQLDKIDLSEITYVVFDTETTGLNPSDGDEIISIGAVRIVNGKLLAHEMMEVLVNPKRSIPAVSTKIHGITAEMLEGQPTIDQVLPRFQQFTENAVLVAHNAAFDMRFLELKETVTGVTFTNPVLDTLLLSEVVHPHQENHGIAYIADRLGVDVMGRHTALGDAMTTAEVYLKLIPLLKSMGIHTLDQAREASMKTGFAKVSY